MKGIFRSHRRWTCSLLMYRACLSEEVASTELPTVCIHVCFKRRCHAMVVVVACCATSGSSRVSYPWTETSSVCANTSHHVTVKCLLACRSREKSAATECSKEAHRAGVRRRMMTVDQSPGLHSVIQIDASLLVRYLVVFVSCT